MTDLTYLDKGLFTTFIPHTAAGEEAWRVMHEANGETVLSIHAKNVISQLRKAGYSVAKAKKVKQSMDNIFAELEELGL